MMPVKKTSLARPAKLPTMAACMDNRISQGSLFRPMSKNELSVGNRPKRVVEYSVNYGGFSYDAKVKQFEALSMADELVLLVCLSMISQFSRGKILSPPNVPVFTNINVPGDDEEETKNHQKLLWEKLKVETSTNPKAVAAGLRDCAYLPVLMLETTPAEILRKLKRDDSGEQIKRLIKSLERLESTTMRFRVHQPDYRFSFASNILAFTYEEPKHNTGTPSLRIAVNHFSVQSLSNKRGGFTLHQVEEKAGMSELESAIHSQLCRLVTPAKTIGVRLEKLFLDAYGVKTTKDLTRFHNRRFKTSLGNLREHLTCYGWKFGDRDATTIDVKRPAPPKPEQFLNQNSGTKSLEI